MTQNRIWADNIISKDVFRTFFKRFLFLFLVIVLPIILSAFNLSVLECFAIPIVVILIFYTAINENLYLNLLFYKLGYKNEEFLKQKKELLKELIEIEAIDKVRASSGSVEKIILELQEKLQKQKEIDSYELKAVLDELLKREFEKNRFVERINYIISIISKITEIELKIFQINLKKEKKN